MVSMACSQSCRAELDLHLVQQSRHTARVGGHSLIEEVQGMAEVVTREVIPGLWEEGEREEGEEWKGGGRGWKEKGRRGR